MAYDELYRIVLSLFKKNKKIKIVYGDFLNAYFPIKFKNNNEKRILF